MQILVFKAFCSLGYFCSYLFFFPDVKPLIFPETQTQDESGEGGRSTPGGEGEPSTSENQSEHMERDDVVNCICQINEENGLMIQVHVH